MRNSEYPCARKEDLVVERLENEILVYDQIHHKAHCLDPNVAHVWRECDGKSSVREIALRLQKKHDLEIDEGVVRVAVQRLGKVHLLKKRVNFSEGVNSRARRDWLKKVALIGGFSIASLMVPSAAMAASCAHSCSGLGDCTPCYNSSTGKCDKVCCRGSCVTKAEAYTKGCKC